MPTGSPGALEARRTVGVPSPRAPPGPHTPGPARRTHARSRHARQQYLSSMRRSACRQHSTQELAAVDAAAVHPAERHRAVSVCGPSHARQTRAVPPIGCPIALRGKHAPDATGGDAPGATPRVSASALRHRGPLPARMRRPTKDRGPGSCCARSATRCRSASSPSRARRSSSAASSSTGCNRPTARTWLILIAGLPPAARDAAGEYCLVLLGALAAHALGALEELGMLGVASARGTRVRAGGETRLLPVV